MVTGISSIAFQAAPGKIPEKLRTKGQKAINQRVINGKTTEVLAKNETVKKSIPKKSKKREF